MKLSYLKSLFVLVVISFFASCGGDDEKDDKKSTKYYIEFSMPDELRFETTNPGFQNCFTCACTVIEDAELSICNETDEFSAADIENLEGEEFTFIEGDYPYASLYFTHNGIDYYSEGAEDQFGSFKVTEVVEDGTFGTYTMYKVTGTFDCIVEADDDGSPIDVIGGKFVLRFSGSNE